MSTYVITFDRISRNHDVAPLTVTASSAEEVAEEVWAYARPKVGSRDVEVVADLDGMTGTIYCGMQVGGHFTIELSQ